MLNKKNKNKILYGRLFLFFIFFAVLVGINIKTAEALDTYNSPSAVRTLNSSSPAGTAFIWGNDPPTTLRTTGRVLSGSGDSVLQTTDNKYYVLNTLSGSDMYGNHIDRGTLVGKNPSLGAYEPFDSYDEINSTINSQGVSTARDFGHVTTTANSVTGQSGYDSAANAPVVDSVTTGKDAIQNFFNSNKCIGWNENKFGVNWGWCAADVTGVLLSWSSWLYEKAGMMMDTTIKYTVLKMSDYIKDGSDLKTVIDTIWKFFRDLGQIILVFALLYLAIMTIIQGSGADTQKMLVTIILMAVLLNFSMLFAKLAIDASNVITVQVYQKIKVTTNSTDEDPNTSGYLASKFSLQSYAENPSVVLANNANDGLNIAFLNIALIAFMLISVVIFLFVAVLFISRFVILMILIMTSSIYFATIVLPQTKSLIGDKWRDALVNQCLFAPVFMILYWASLKAIDSLTKNIFKDVSDTSWSDLVSTEDNIDNVIIKLMSFLICIGMLIASFVIAKQIADKAGEGSSKLTGYIGRGVGNATLGLTGLAGRQILGRVGNRLARMEGKGMGSVALKRFGGWMSKKSFDARNIGAVSNIAGMAGIDIGKGAGKGGRSKIPKQKQETFRTNIERYSADEDKTKARLASSGDTTYTGLQTTLTEANRLRDEAKIELQAARAALATARTSGVAADIAAAENAVATKQGVYASSIQNASEAKDEHDKYVRTHTPRYEAAKRAENAKFRSDRRVVGESIRKELEKALDPNVKATRALTSAISKMGSSGGTP